MPRASARPLALLQSSRRTHLGTTGNTSVGHTASRQIPPGSRHKAYVEAAGWGGPNMWFNRVPEQKTAKNRIHFDLRAPGSVADEVARLTTLGATALRVGEDLTVMADPEGNEFCVE